MWENKEQAINLSYNADELWFKGVYGQSVNKPLEIRKWEENTKFFKLLDKTYPRSKADRILQDLSLIALTFSKHAVEQRLTFKPNSKGENTDPVVFRHDPNGDLIELALELRTVSLARPPKDSSLTKEEDFDDAEFTKTFFVEHKANRILLVTLAGYCVHSTLVPAIVPKLFFAPSEEIHMKKIFLSNGRGRAGKRGKRGT